MFRKLMATDDDAAHSYSSRAGENYCLKLQGEMDS
jgi:hypothetical protein